MHDASCPNCQREFYAFTDGEYCPECWKAWGKADGSFEVRSKDMAAILHRQLRRPRLKPVFQPPVQGEDANG